MHLQPRDGSVPLPSLMTEDEVAHYLRFSVRTLQILIDRGQFPEGLNNTERGRVWRARDVLWYEIGMDLRYRLVNRKAQKDAAKSMEGKKEERDENAPH